ncbi:hypothetical protein GGQ54_001708 [Naumannella cuiyingiana]|uniref:Uncharacterized protein n=1 Tax=Naumannella cuiyingiana TaxID=1347891 RepID=A0A7Z0IL29_9ACTN|nr:hypothetical protein [Naumannella cuiyingiana]NYI71148.1 hypothetical protein [Naumannella cuiyingiana]
MYTLVIRSLLLVAGRRLRDKLGVGTGLFAVLLGAALCASGLFAGIAVLRIAEAGAVARAFEPGIGYLLATVVGIGVSYSYLVSVVLGAGFARGVIGDLASVPIGRRAARRIGIGMILVPPTVAGAAALALLVAYYLGTRTVGFPVLAILAFASAVLPMVSVLLTGAERVVAHARRTPGMPGLTVHLAVVGLVSAVALGLYFAGIEALVDHLSIPPIGWFYTAEAGSSPDWWVTIGWLVVSAAIIAGAGAVERSQLPRRADSLRSGPRRNLVAFSDRPALAITGSVARGLRRRVGMLTEVMPWMLPVGLAAWLGGVVLQARYVWQGTTGIVVAGILTSGPGHRLSAFLSPFEEYRRLGLSYREWVLLLAGARLVWCLPVTVVGLAVLLMTGGTGAAVVALIVGSLVIQALFAALSMVARRIGPSAPTASLFGVIVCGVCSILAGLILGAAAGDLLP